MNCALSLINIFTSNVVPTKSPNGVITQKINLALPSTELQSYSDELIHKDGCSVYLLTKYFTHLCQDNMSDFYLGGS